jgi:outer membrane receptor for ferrienterochelin and colicins
MHTPRKAFLSVVSLFSISALAQETVIDSVHSRQLDEVVVTGQLEPQSLKKSVSNVRVITRADIDRQAANNMADLMNFYLNINVTQDTGQGRSTVSMFGLDGQYLKVLVDNVPLVSDTGLGNNIDLTQINLDDVQQVEIIEGSMGVTHGANAVSGIINIITKKSTLHKWEINAAAQEETVGKEYAAFDKGRHIQSLKISHNISEHWFASIGGNRNDFSGFQDRRGGQNYLNNETDVNLQRGYSWLPKEQYVANAMVSYKKDKTRVFYKFDYFNENIDYYNPIVSIQPNYPFWDILFGNDRRYKTERLYHHLNASGHVFKNQTYTVSASYQKQTRDFEDFKYYIEERREAEKSRLTYQSTEILYSTGSISNLLNNKKYNLQLGYEFVNEKGFASAQSGLFLNPDNVASDKKATLTNTDVYTAAEVAFTDKFSGRGGLRYSAQSKFDNQYAASLGLRYLVAHGIELRSSLGKSYRTPNFEELYTYFVDSNHDVQGNANLLPEESISVDANLKKLTVFASGVNMSNSIMATYLDVQDRIGLVLTSVVAGYHYKYINVDSYRVWNFSTNHQWDYKNLSVKVGGALVGVSQKIDSGLAVSDDKYLFSLQLNGNVNYAIPKIKTDFSVYYKLNGKQQQLVETTDADGNNVFAISKIDSFSWLNASVRKSFFANRFDVTLGARNLLDVTNVQSTIAQGGSLGHGGGSTDLPTAYGRSYFLKLAYNINL